MLYLICMWNDVGICFRTKSIDLRNHSMQRRHHIIVAETNLATITKIHIYFHPVISLVVMTLYYLHYNQLEVEIFYVPSAMLSTSEKEMMDSSSLPLTSTVSIEARVLSVGPSYVDIVVTSGLFERSFGVASNDISGLGDKSMRFRADRFFSEVPYQRMVAALSQLTTIVPNDVKPPTKELKKGTEKQKHTFESNDKSNVDDADKTKGYSMDRIFHEMILSTFALTDSHSPLYNDISICHVDDLSKQISRPPMGPMSQKLANDVLQYIRANPQNIFRPFNGPQLHAIEAALTRRLTLIQVCHVYGNEYHFDFKSVVRKKNTTHIISSNFLYRALQEQVKLIAQPPSGLVLSINVDPYHQLPFIPIIKYSHVHSVMSVLIM
jgi:hypothetical protein